MGFKVQPPDIRWNTGEVRIEVLGNNFDQKG